jgi:hypothetical protein
MADKKVTELTQVAVLPDTAKIYAVDTTRAIDDQDLQIAKSNLLAGVIQTEEEVIGTASENATMTGTVNLDLDTFSYFQGILTGATTVTVTNPPAVNTSIVRNLMIKSTTTQALTLPVGWTIIGEYLADGSDNYFTIIFSNLTTAGERVVCYISQA